MAGKVKDILRILILVHDEAPFILLLLFAKALTYAKVYILKDLLVFFFFLAFILH